MEEKAVFRVNSKVSRKREVPEPSPLQSDQDLIRQVKRGNQEAFTQLYERYWYRVLNYLYRFTGNRATAEELTQETFLRVAQNLYRYRPTGSVGGWIFRIARNLGLNAVRDSKMEGAFSLDEPLELGEDSVDRKEAIPGRGPMPDEVAVRREQEEAIQRCLLKIAPHHREVLILCDIERRSYQEAAELLRCPMNTVASRLARARAQMAELLGYLRKER